MQHDEFIGQVQHRARLASRGEAEMVTRATLETLGERLYDDTADNLAAQLPPEIGRHLQESGDYHKYSLDEFLECVKEREGEGVDLPDAVHHARAVIAELEESVSEGLIEKVRNQLPPEYGRLFDAGSEGEMPPER
ncbi:MAG: DUF2267 domain-containing protein [bacterium]|nr:DUF2267 domain-containing protein [bacterium]